MLHDFEVITPLFEGQANERFQFKLNIEGNDYRGVFLNGEVQWYQPQPQVMNSIGDVELNRIESNIFNLMIDHYYNDNFNS